LVYFLCIRFVVFVYRLVNKVDHNSKLRASIFTKLGL